MGPELEQAGLPLSFSSTKVTKKSEKNRKKKAQKRGRKFLKNQDTHSNNDAADQFNYAEEFNILTVLTEYRKSFSILVPKSERFNSEKEVEIGEEVREMEEVNFEDGNCELDYGFDSEETQINHLESELIPSVDLSIPSKSNHLHKYYQQRYDYFSLFDEGIQIDEEGWYSVTPEIIADHIAKEAHAIAITNKTGNEAKDGKTIILDAFCGVGGNTIQFSKYFDKVIAVDLDIGRLEMARHNATIYGVADRIEFVHGDVFKILPEMQLTERIDLVFMSPPWGGPNYVNRSIFCPRLDILDGRGQELYDLGRSISKNLIIFLPRQSDIYSVAEMCKDSAKKDDSFVVEQHWLRNRLKAISIYFY